MYSLLIFVGKYTLKMLELQYPRKRLTFLELYKVENVTFSPCGCLSLTTKIKK